MAQNIASTLSYFVKVQLQYKDDLKRIRQWQNLKAAHDDDCIWVKDFDYAQINSALVKSIPYKKIYDARNGKLFSHNSRLPECNIPSLLWSPIERILPITLPSFNHNYFGLNQQLSFKLVPSIQEMNAAALLVSLEILEQFLNTTAKFRTQNLKWLIINHESALIIGNPMPPLPGTVYWQRDNCLIPCGLDFDLYLCAAIAAQKTDPDNNHYLVWHGLNKFFMVQKKQFEELSLSSFRLTVLNSNSIDL